MYKPAFELHIHPLINPADLALRLQISAEVSFLIC